MVSGFLEERFSEVVESYDLLSPKDKIKVFTELLPYGLPKLQPESSNEFENMSDEQLDAIINRLKSQYTNEQ